MTAFDWIRRLPVGDRTRRVLDETLADAAHERRTATSAAGTVTAMARMTGGLARAVIALGGVFEEGYPMRNLGQDFRYGLRRLRASPAFAIFSILTLALGIGATTAIVSMVRTVTDPPPGIRDPANVFTILRQPGGGSVPMMAFSWADYRDLKAQQTSFEQLTAWIFTMQAYVANGHSETGFGEVVDGDYFSLLGVQAALGRPLEPADDRAGAPPVVVISDRVWRRVFDAAPDVVGRSIVINGSTFQIVGVAPASFAGVFNGGLIPTAMWLSMGSVPSLTAPGVRFRLDDDRDNRWLLVKGRLKPGRTVEAARAELGVIAGQLDTAHPLDTSYRTAHPERRQWTMLRLTEVGKIEGGDRIVRQLVATVLVAVTLVLMVACTNLANLALARGSARRHDVAVRLALGASRWRLMREALTESACLVAAGGIVGFGVARVLLVVIGTDIDVGPGVLHAEPTLDAGVFLAAAAATLLALLVAGVVPALQSTRADVRTALVADGSGSASPRWRGRRWLISLQVAVSLVLLAMATVSADQVRRELHRDTGISIDQLAVAEVDFQLQRVDDARVPQLAGTIVEMLKRQPGVTAAAVSSGLPFGLSNPGGVVTSADKPFTPGHYRGKYVQVLVSSPSVLQTLGVAIQKGRALSDRDTASSEAVVVISKVTAEAVFGTTDVVGLPIQFQMNQWAGMAEPPVVTKTIVGVAADTDTSGPGSRASGTVYMPVSQQAWGRLTFLARTSGDPAAIVPVLRKTINAIDPNLAIGQLGTASALTGASNLFLQIVAGVSGLLGSFALALSLAGLYGVLSHIVGRRVREMGVRTALGATSRQLERLVILDGVRPVLMGIALGVVLGVIARVALNPIFTRSIPSIDPFAVLLAPALILAAGWLACYLPARRASRVDPNIALREL